MVVHPFLFCKNKQCLLGKQERTYKLDSYIDVTIIEKQTNRKYKKMQNLKRFKMQKFIFVKYMK